MQESLAEKMKRLQEEKKTELEIAKKELEEKEVNVEKNEIKSQTSKPRKKKTEQLKIDVETTTKDISLDMLRYIYTCISNKSDYKKYKKNELKRIINELKGDKTILIIF